MIIKNKGYILLAILVTMGIYYICFPYRAMAKMTEDLAHMHLAFKKEYDDLNKSLSYPDKKFFKTYAAFFKVLQGIPMRLVAPASGVMAQWLSTLAMLRDKNLLQLHIQEDAFDESKSFFCSNTEEIRFKLLKEALIDDSIPVIWTIRGGYGASHLISALQKMEPPKKEKIFIGFSDITALHLFLSQKWGWKTIHGGAIVQLLDRKKDPKNFEKVAAIIVAMLSGKIGNKKKISSTLQDALTIHDLLPFNAAAKVCTSVKGKITGGNLCLIKDSIGTDWQIETQGKILFLEDTDYLLPCELDRMFSHIKQAKLLDKVTAIVLGSFTNDNQYISQMLRDIADPLTIPVFKCNRFGHDSYNDPIVYHTDTEIRLSMNHTFDLMMHLE